MSTKFWTQARYAQNLHFLVSCQKKRRSIWTFCVFWRFLLLFSFGLKRWQYISCSILFIYSWMYFCTEWRQLDCNLNISDAPWVLCWSEKTQKRSISSVILLASACVRYSLMEHAMRIETVHAFPLQVSPFDASLRQLSLISETMRWTSSNCVGYSLLLGRKKVNELFGLRMTKNKTQFTVFVGLWLFVRLFVLIQFVTMFDHQRIISKKNSFSQINYRHCHRSLRAVMHFN